MAIDKKHLEDIRVYTDVFYKLCSDIEIPYEELTVNKTPVVVVPEFRNLNTDFLHIDIYSLIGMMNSDHVIDGLDDERLEHAIKTGEFHIRNHSYSSSKTQKLFMSNKITQHDILYKTGELVIKEKPYKLVLKRDYGRSPWEEFLVADGGVHIERGYIENKQILKFIRNSLAHSNYEFRDGRIYVEYGSKKLDFSLSWLSGFSRFLHGFQTCEIKNDGKFNSLYIPVLPSISEQNDFMREYKGGDNSTKLTKYFKAGSTIIVTMHTKLDMVRSELSERIADHRFYSLKTIEEQLEYIKSNLKTLDLKEKDFSIEVKPMAEVYSNFALENMSYRILQIEEYFERSNIERGEILNSVFMSNQTEKLLGLPSSVGTGILYTMQEIAEQLIPSQQKDLQFQSVVDKTYDGIMERNFRAMAVDTFLAYEKREGKVLSREIKRSLDLYKAGSTKQLTKGLRESLDNLTKKMKENLIEKEFKKAREEETEADKFYVSDTLPDWKRIDAKNCVVLLSAYNALIGTKFVDDLCSSGLITSDILCNEDLKLIEKLDVTGFKVAYAENFSADDFEDVLGHRGKYWKDAEKSKTPLDTKVKMLNTIRTAITHGTVGFLYGPREEFNEIVFFKKSSATDPVTKIIKCNVDTAFKFFQSDSFFADTKTRKLLEAQELAAKQKG